MQYDTIELVWAILIIGLAGLLRGVTGFGAALIAVPLLTLIFPPHTIVPVILVMQFVANFGTVVANRAIIEWRPVIQIFLGTILGTLIGINLLLALPEVPVRILIVLAVTSSVVALGAGFKLKTAPGPIGTFAVGSLSGVFNGLAALGGPPAIVYFMVYSATADCIRASLCAAFLLMGMVGIAIFISNGRMSADVWILSAILSPAMLLSGFIGGIIFRWLDSTTYRRIGLLALCLAIVIATGDIVKTVLSE